MLILLLSLLSLFLLSWVCVDRILTCFIPSMHASQNQRTYQAIIPCCYPLQGKTARDKVIQITAIIPCCEGNTAALAPSLHPFIIDFVG